MCTLFANILNITNIIALTFIEVKEKHNAMSKWTIGFLVLLLLVLISVSLIVSLLLKGTSKGQENGKVTNKLFIIIPDFI